MFKFVPFRQGWQGDGPELRAVSTTLCSQRTIPYLLFPVT